MEKNEQTTILLEAINQAGQEIGINITDTATGEVQMLLLHLN